MRLRRATAAGAIAIAGLGMTLGVVACGGSEPAREDVLMAVFRQAAQEEGLSRVETDGKRLFAHYCETCHGEIGAGDGQNAYNLDPPPPEFGVSLPERPAAYRRQLVEGGSAAMGRSPLCPPWGRNLSAAEIDALMAFLEVLARPPSSTETTGGP